jgi:hypothetical protein
MAAKLQTGVDHSGQTRDHESSRNLARKFKQGADEAHPRPA